MQYNQNLPTNDLDNLFYQEFSKMTPMERTIFFNKNAEKFNKSKIMYFLDKRLEITKNDRNFSSEYFYNRIDDDERLDFELLAWSQVRYLVDIVDNDNVIYTVEQYYNMKRKRKIAEKNYSKFKEAIENQESIGRQLYPVRCKGIYEDMYKISMDYAMAVNEVKIKRQVFEKSKRENSELCCLVSNFYEDNQKDKKYFDMEIKTNFFKQFDHQE